MMLLGRRDVWEILWGVLGNQHVVIRPLCRELCVGGGRSRGPAGVSEDRVVAAADFDRKPDKMAGPR